MFYDTSASHRAPRQSFFTIAFRPWQMLTKLMAERRDHAIQRCAAHTRAPGLLIQVVRHMLEATQHMRAGTVRATDVHAASFTWSISDDVRCSPMFASFFVMSGVLRILAVALLMRSITGRGVPAGASSPYQELTS